MRGVAMSEAQRRGLTRWLEDLPLKTKITLIVIVSAGMVLVLACGALATYETYDFRRAMSRDATILANILGQTSQAAITFEDEKAASVLLGALKSEPHVVAARLFDRGGVAFADYVRTNSKTTLADKPGVDGHHFADDHLALFHPIMLDGDRIGTIYLQMDLKRMYERLYLFAGTAGLVLIVSLLVVWATSIRLQQVITRPILKLAEIARIVAERRDYTVRAPDQGANEIGTLTLAFNHMLTQIHQQNVSLQESEKRERFLAEASALLSGSLELERTLTDLAKLAVPGLADWCAIDMWDNGELRRVAVQHRDSSRTQLAMELHRRYPPRPQDPGFAVAMGEPAQLLDSVDISEVRARMIDDEQLRLVMALGLNSYALIPLRTRNRTLGVVSLVTEGTRRLDRADLPFLEEIGQRAAIAVENAQLYEDERAARNFAADKAEALARSNAELEQFAYVASHDLQEPLRMVQQYLNLLELRLSSKFDDSTWQFMHYALEGAQRMNALINDLLGYARIGHGEQLLQDIDLNRIVLEAEENLRLKIEESGAQIVCDSLPMVRADKLQLVQVIQNLLGNALKFRGTEAPCIHISCESDDDRWVVSVQDNGIGIEPAYQKRIFDVFQRLHGRQEYPGTGIGLAICKRIVERHGGRIWVESEAGKGATFKFTMAKSLKTGPSSSTERVERQTV
jgi:signal transduction histidine kinase